MIENKKIVMFFFGLSLIIALLGFIASEEYEDCFPYDLDRLSYSTRNTGDIISLAGYDEFESENVKFTHGNIYKGRGILYQGKGGIYAEATTIEGDKIKLNVRTSVNEIIENTCEKITWRNTGLGTYWVYREGTQRVEYDYIDITYYPKTGKIKIVGVGDIDFELEDMIDKRFEPGSIPLVPEFGFIVGMLTILSAVSVFFVIRRR